MRELGIPERREEGIVDEGGAREGESLEARKRGRLERASEVLGAFERELREGELHEREWETGDVVPRPARVLVGRDLELERGEAFGGVTKRGAKHLGR